MAVCVSSVVLRVSLLGTNLLTSKPTNHQAFQVPKMEVLTYISCMDTAYVREVSQPPK